MNYTSTRDNSVQVQSHTAITKGISADGGLFVPESFPAVSLKELDAMVSMTYNQRAMDILGRYLTDFTEEEIKTCVECAYTAEKFGGDTPAPVKMLPRGMNILELWHGPTCAFKDMALQILPHLLSVSSEKQGENKEIVILVATSGDTGKAALEGFKDAQGTKILVFYPEKGVSAMQKRQMNTQEGGNVAVCAIEGNFDDAQTGVKKIFTDPKVNQMLQDKGMMFSSANSINWGRLLPQIVYYFSAYCDLVKAERIRCGDKINFVVPTGNFGNILAAYYALRMGLPVNKLICASNKNNILTDFIETGCYDKERSFHTTISPSMDILISSNLERLLFDLCSKDSAFVAGLMEALRTKGKYTITKEMQAKLGEIFAGGYCDDFETQKTIEFTYEDHEYLCDTHTSVAVSVYQDYAAKTGDETQTVVVSTASPYKFAASVLESFGETGVTDEFEQLDKLYSLTFEPIPEQIANLKEKALRFKDVCTIDKMEEKVFELLKIQ